MFRPTSLLLSWCLAAFALVLSPPARGQAPPPAEPDKPQNLSAREAIPEKPPSGLLDEGNVFNDEDRVLASADREDFGHRVGLPLFVVTAHYIFGETVDHYGQRLLNAWLKDQPGIVMFYERGSRQLNFSATPGALGSNDDLQALFLAGSKAGAMMPEEASAAQRLRAVMQTLTTAGEALKKTGKVPSDEPAPGQPASTGSTAPESKPVLPEPPVDFVRDDADAFDVAEETELKTELVKFHSRNDIDIYVITHSVLPDTTAQFHAEALAREWLKNRPGAVIVMNRGTAADEEPLGIGSSPLSERVLTPAALFIAEEQARKKSKAIQREPQGSIARGVRAAAGILMEAFGSRGAAAARAQAGLVTSSGQWNVLTAIAGALVIGSLLLYLFHRFQERLETRANEQFFFPDVTVDRRLGSPQGGGQIAGITFRDKP